MRERERGIGRRTTAAQRVATGRAGYLARRIGVALKEARVALGMRQVDAAMRAGITQAHWSRIERGVETGTALDTIAACAAAVSTQLAAFVEAMPGADLPRDIEHLRRQSLIVRIAELGGWRAVPEAAVPGHGGRPRSIDVLLLRDNRREAAVVEVWDLILDGGEAMRGLESKVMALRERLGPEWQAQGLLVVRRTRRNQVLVADLRPLFAARFPASSAAWLAALASSLRPMPDADGFAWTTVSGDRLTPARLR